MTTGIGAGHAVGLCDQVLHHFQGSVAVQTCIVHICSKAQIERVIFCHALACGCVGHQLLEPATILMGPAMTVYSTCSLCMLCWTQSAAQDM